MCSIYKGTTPSDARQYGRKKGSFLLCLRSDHLNMGQTGDGAQDRPIPPFSSLSLASPCMLLFALPCCSTIPLSVLHVVTLWGWCHLTYNGGREKSWCWSCHDIKQRFGNAGVCVCGTQGERQNVAMMVLWAILGFFITKPNQAGLV